MEKYHKKKYPRTPKTPFLEYYEVKIFIVK